MNWKTILITGSVLILWLFLVIFIKTNKRDAHEAEMATAKSDQQPQQNKKSLAEIQEEIQFIVQESIEEEIQKEVQKQVE